MRSERKFLGILEVDGFMSEKTLVKTNFFFPPREGIVLPRNDIFASFDLFFQFFSSCSDSFDV